MKIFRLFDRKRNQVSFLIALSFVLISMPLAAQTDQVYARVALHKVSPDKIEEYEKAAKEIGKPVRQAEKQSGKIIGWYMYKVHFSGANDEYNYVTVTYYNSWVNTEGNENWIELIKAALPKADPAATAAKIRSLRTIVRESLYSRVDQVTAQNPPPAKYILLDFMKVKPGMYQEYVKVETEDWKPIHKILADEKKRVGWRLWSLVLPAGSNSTHDFVTANVFSSYAQIAEGSYEEAFKKAFPGKDMAAAFDKTMKTRDLVKSELWELIESLN